ncbi:MAG TPA: hypothetical protein VJH22_03815 [Candidatus Nanoarchaeia archaeon]|nr:hypothetical protein [Candidatus Nanoarchaeia archaeon]
MKNMPVYVKIDEYKDIVDIINLTHDKIKKARELMRKIAELKRQEDQTLEHWRQELDAVETRVTDIDRKLFEQR